MYQIMIKKGRKIVDRKTYDSYDLAMEKLDYYVDAFRDTQYGVEFKSLNHSR